jgi:magnesium and cobalt transporter
MNIFKYWLQWLHKKASPKNQDELVAVLQRAKDNNVIDNETVNMFKGALQVSQMQVREAMIPRPQMAVIDGYLTPQEALPQVIDARHSRFPVTGEDRDEIVGILLAKDLLKFSLTETPPETQVRQLVRPATFIP